MSGMPAWGRGGECWISLYRSLQTALMASHNGRTTLAKPETLDSWRDLIDCIGVWAMGPCLVGMGTAV